MGFGDLVLVAPRFADVLCHEEAVAMASGAADILVRDGRIAEIGTGLDVPSGIERVDADGLVALPGLVDLHTHLREPGREDAETIRTVQAAVDYIESKQ